MNALDPTRRPMAKRVSAAMAVVAMLVTACGSSSPTASGQPSGESPGLTVRPTQSAAPSGGSFSVTPTTGPSATDVTPTIAPGDKEAAYGLPPTTDGSITYQPDVVIVDGGAQAVRSVSSDGILWTIDANAGHASELAVGRIMFLTSRAVGRVLALERNDDALTLTLGPVDLTDVISDGQISVRSEIPMDSLVGLSVPGEPTAIDYTETPAEGHGAAPAILTLARVPNAIPERGPRFDTEGPTLPPPTTGSTTELTLGPFSVELSRSSADGGRIGLKAGYQKNGVTIGADFGAILQNPIYDVAVDIASGHISTARMRIEGLKQLTVKLDAGSETGLAGNFKARAEVPFEFDIPIAAPIPINLSIRQKFIVETAFSAKNSTVSATGVFGLSGPIGFDYQGGTLTVLTPAVVEEKSLVDSLSGISVGVNGVVVAYQMKVLAGLGVPLFTAGPFAAMTVSTGLTVGSDLGIVKCRLASLDVVAAGGLGYTFSSAGSGLVTKFFEKLGLSGVKLDSEYANVTQTLLHQVRSAPDVPVCKS
ncbi:MAG: hypothetical protein ABIZ34_02685 [Candidatus Limnocylindrales bacterium]